MSENLFPKPVTVHRLTFRFRALHLSVVVIHCYGKLAPGGESRVKCDGIRSIFVWCEKVTQTSYFNIVVVVT